MARQRGPVPKLYPVGNREISLSQAARECCRDRELLRQRVEERGMSLEEAMTAPIATKYSNRRAGVAPVTAEDKRAECVAEILARMDEPGSVVDVQAALLAAWDAGHETGARS